MCAPAGSDRAGRLGCVLDLFGLQSDLLTLIFLVLLVIKVFAMVDAVMHSPDAYVHAGKLTKNAWLLILGLGLAVHFVEGNPIGILSLLGTVAALVYLADARPALRSMRRGR